MGSVNLQDGSYRIFNETLSPAELAEAALMSASIPGLFEFQSAFGGDWIDGGTMYGNDIFEAVKRCLAVNGGIEKDVVIDTLEIRSHTLSVDNDDDLNSFDVLFRGLEIGNYDKDMRLIYEGLLSYPEVFFRYYVQPSENLGLIPFDFSHNLLMEQYALGQSDAEYLVKNGIYTRDILKPQKEEAIYAD